MKSLAALLGRGRSAAAPSGGEFPGPGPEAFEPLLDRPATEVPFLVLDTELTGLDPCRDSIVSIGAVPMEGGKIALGGHFSQHVSPRSELTAKSILIHGITPGEAAASPEIEQALPGFVRFCGSRVLVGHVVGIDMEFVNRECRRLWGRPLPHPSLDTLALHRFLQRKREDPCAFHEGGPGGGTDLFSLAAAHGIRVRGAHTALGDAFTTAQLLQRLLHDLASRGVTTLRDLIKIGGI